MLVAVALVAVSCSRGVSRIQTRSLAQPNPTSWTFPLPLPEIRARALEAFSMEHQTDRLVFGATFYNHVFALESCTNAVFAAAIFQDPANTNDIYLHTFHAPFVASPVYHGRKGGLPFIAAFHLHLAAAGSNTLVTVTALDTEVVNGQKFGVGSCGPGYGNNYVKVKPTTIEEYSLLRYLGHCLGLTNMPPVILPKS